MSEMIEIQWNTGSIDEVRKVCRYLVQERLVASAEIIPWIESICLLNNQIETVQETKAILKTKKAYYEKIQEVILKNSNYEIPEITSVELLEISPSYLAWINESLVEF